MISTTSQPHSVLVLDNELGMGGSEKLLYDFVTRFDRDRFGLGICCLKNGGYWKRRMVDLGIPFYERILRGRFDLLAFRRLARILREQKVELIDTYSHPNTVILSYLAKTFGLIDRFVVAFHAMGNPEGGRLVPAYLKPFLGEADALIALSPTHRRYLVEAEGLQNGQIEVIYNGVDTEQFRPPAGDEIQRLRAEFGFERTDIVVTAVASLKPAKRIDLLLESTVGVVESGLRTRVLLVGDGPDRDRLDSLASRLEMGDSVTFAGVRDDVADILRMSDMLVLSSRMGTETFPTVVLEAMATGLPVVTTDVGSVRDMVEDGHSAIVVPPDDREAMLTAIEAVLNDPSMGKAFGERGRQIVLDRFDVDTMCENRQRLFERLLAGDIL